MLSIHAPIKVLHGADPDVVYDQAPDLCLGDAITPVHEIAMLVSGDGPVLQHMVQLGTDPVVVLAREAVPESLLCGLQFPFHCVYLLTVPRSGRPRHRFTCREV